MAIGRDIYACIERESKGENRGKRRRLQQERDGVWRERERERE